jgi:hypothetical protein
MTSLCMGPNGREKRFPKNYQQNTEATNDGYPLYRTKDNIPQMVLGNFHIDNRWFVAYNPYFLKKYEGHWNVEVKVGLSSVKNLFK